MERCEMWQSEDSDVEDGQEKFQHNIIYPDNFPVFHMEPPDALYKRWAQINPELRRETGRLLHISVFWWHILYKQQDNHSTTAWAVDMGFLDSNVSNDLSLKRLHRIEILELILDAVEKCLAGTDPEKKARELQMISMSLGMEYGGLAKAVNWLNGSGTPGLFRRILHLGPKQIRHQVLDFVFAEYSRYIQVMSCSKKKTLGKLSLVPEPWCLQKSEEMKNKGNEQFQRRNFDLAVKWYTKAIKHHTNNHILYGNRSLCYLRCEKYLKAMGDGKRAVLLQRDWAKGHYRFCDALFYLGARDKAVEANLTAQSYCSADPEGMKDLQQQYNRFMTEISEGRAEAQQTKSEAKKGSNKRPDDACGVNPMAQHVHPDKASETVPSSDTTVNKKPEDRKQEETSAASAKPVTDSQGEDNFKDAQSEMGDRKARKAAPGIQEKQTVRNKLPPFQAPSGSSEGCRKEQFCAAVRDAHIALSDQRSRNAEQSFSEALRILNSIGTKDLGICEIDKNLLIYGYATALIEIGQPEELAEAQLNFKKLSSTANRTFQSLVHYGSGKVSLKENKFIKAKDEFLKALLMVQRQIMPGKLTWPTTKVTVTETCPEYLTEQLESFIKICKFPPKPDAVCRHCVGKALIYFTDPDFKGFIRLSCSQSCNVEYHINCWKKFKAASFSDKNDKDFLQDFCFTPDCAGKVFRIVIFDSTGLIKCEFKSPVTKRKIPGIRVKQKCTSLKKLNSKEERKLRRKQKRATLSLTTNEKNYLKIEDENGEKADSADQASLKDYATYGDRVLHQIDKNRDLFDDEPHDMSGMLLCLSPWMKLDENKGRASVLKDRAEVQLLRDLVDLLLERKNRVWARILLHSLSGHQHVKPKTLEWAQQLNNAGLKAAEKFIRQFADHLEELDLSSLLEFPPLHDVFPSADFALIEYMRHAPPQEMRLFIWTLEEHREHYPSWFIMLDDYFEMDSICLVLKKTIKYDHLTSVYKSKSKHRKKRPKEPKSVLFLPGRREEEENCFLEENSLMLLDGGDPFSVPDYLREQVAEFEGQYVNPGYSTHLKRFLDNSPDPTKESLFEYFAQILEEHGPLEVSDHLLVGELENFPPEAQQKIDAAGGLEHFLLESLRFAMWEGVVGLASHAVCFQPPLDDDASLPAHFLSHACSTDDSKPKGFSPLDPTAKEFLPQSTHLSPIESGESYEPHLSCPVLPSPYVLIPQDVNYLFGTGDIPSAPKPEEEYSDYIPNFQPDGFNADDFSGDNYISFKADTCAKSKTVFVQTIWGNKDTRVDVAINTEPYEEFEKNRGDMIQTEKNNIKFEKRILNVKEMLNVFRNESKESCSVLDAEVEEISQHIQISNKELSLFQQKLEDEVRKDQQEKRDHQETVKLLKAEVKELVDVQESLSKRIQEKNVEHHRKLNHYLSFSNHCAAKKMSLEESINKCRDECAKATSRCLAGQLSVLKNRREHGLRSPRKFLTNGKAILKQLTDRSPMHLIAGFNDLIEAWKSCIQEVEENIAETERQYEEQIELVKKGISLSSLPAVVVPSTPAPPAVPAFLHPLSNKQPAVQRTHPLTPHGVQQRPAGPQVHAAGGPRTHHASRTPPAATENLAAPATSATVQPPQPLAVFERIIDRLSSMFPHYSRSVLMKFIQEVRSMNGGSLSMLKYEELINRAAQLILDHQEHSQAQINLMSAEMAGARDQAAPSPTPPSTDSSRATATASPPHVWKSVSSSQQRKSSRALNMEDPCIICHDEMMPEDLCVLECRHSFHTECIKSWLKEQSTCPTCREHALLPEDFPMLPGRHRRGHMHAATFF